MKQKYLGGCQCGKVQFEVELELGEVISCNCSRCQRLGTLMAFAPAGDFTLLSGDEALTEYSFNKHIIHHLFCSNCGVQSSQRASIHATAPTWSPSMFGASTRSISTFEDQESRRPRISEGFMSATIRRSVYADMFGPTTGDRVRLADTDIIIEVEKDFTTYGEEVKFGGGKVIRDRLSKQTGLLTNFTNRVAFLTTSDRSRVRASAPGSGCR